MLYFISDLHLDTSQNQRSIKRVLPLLEELVVGSNGTNNHFFIAGDIFDKPTPPKKIKKIFYSFLKKHSEENTFHLILGNHDKPSYESELHSLYDLESIGLNDSIRIYTHPTCLEIDNVNFIILPWLMHKEQDPTIEINDYIKKDARSNIVVGHFVYSGCLAGGGILLEEGEFFFDKSDFSEIDLAIAGHIHTPQTIDDKVIYLGSFCALNWGEAKSLPHYYMKMDLNPTINYELVKVPDVSFINLNFDSVEDLSKELSKGLINIDTTALYKIVINENPATANRAMLDLTLKKHFPLINNVTIKYSYARDSGLIPRLKNIEELSDEELLMTFLEEKVEQEEAQQIIDIWKEITTE